MCMLVIFYSNVTELNPTSTYTIRLVAIGPDGTESEPSDVLTVDTQGRKREDILPTKSCVIRCSPQLLVAPRSPAKKKRRTVSCLECHPRRASVRSLGSVFLWPDAFKACGLIQERQHFFWEAC